MTMQQESLFEAPAQHEGHQFSQELGSYEMPFSWEAHGELTEDEAWSGESPESLFEDEVYPSHEGLGYANQEMANLASYERGFESAFEDETGMEASWEADPFLGGLLSSIGSSIGLEASGEWSGEADQFFGKALRAIKKVALRALPMATKLLGGMVPGGSIVSGIAGQLLREGTAEAVSMEAQLFNPELSAELGAPEQALEAALTEILAAEAASAGSSAEASSVIAATLPITITIMGGRRALRPVVPTLTQANSRLVTALQRQGPVGVQLIRTVPAIQRRTVGTLRAAARRGHPITGPLAVSAMAGATRSVLGNPRTLRNTLAQNAAVTARNARGLSGGVSSVPRRGGARPLAYGAVPRRSGF